MAQTEIVDDLAAYRDGLSAGHHTGKYKDAQGIIVCPYDKETSPADYEEWYEGLGHGTEDEFNRQALSHGDANVR